MNMFHDSVGSKYEPLSPTIGCLSKTATARESYTYSVLPVDSCYWEKKCDDTLSTCSSAYSTIRTKTDQLLPGVLDPATYDGDPEPPDAVPDPFCRGVAAFRNPVADGVLRAVALGCPDTIAAPILPPYPGIVPDLQVSTPATMRNVCACHGRINIVGADVKNISIKRLYVLNTILSTMLIMCCLAAILYLVFYMFERTDT